MRSLKLIFLILIALSVLLLGILFTIHNTERVHIDLIWLQLPEASLSLWLVAFFAAGVVFGVLLSSVRNLSLKLKAQQAYRKQRKAETQLKQLQQKA